MLYHLSCSTKEKDAFRSALFASGRGLRELFEGLSKLRIQDAQASVPHDKEHIMQTIDKAAEATGQGIRKAENCWIEMCVPMVWSVRSQSSCVCGQRMHHILQRILNWSFTCTWVTRIPKQSVELETVCQLEQFPPGQDFNKSPKVAALNQSVKEKLLLRGNPQSITKHFQSLPSKLNVLTYPYIS